MHGRNICDRTRACRGARGARILNYVMRRYKQHFLRETQGLLLACIRTTLSHDIRYEYELNATRFKSWTSFTERGNRRGMRVTDCDSKSVTRGVASGKVKLRENRFAICRIVEKHLARGRTDAQALGGVVGHRRGSRAAINKKQAAPSQCWHQLR